MRDAQVHPGTLAQPTDLPPGSLAFRFVNQLPQEELRD
jgi:hypothetical protein